MREALIKWMCVGAFAGVVAPWCGCIAIYRHHDVKVRVVDGETQQPVPKASVDVRYRSMWNWNPPPPVHSLTDANGEATLRLATYKSGADWEVGKDGYIREQ